MIQKVADTEGGNKSTLRLRVSDTRKDLPYQIDGVSAGVVWAKDGTPCFYTLLNETMRATQVMRHIIGTSADNDVLIFEESNHAFQVSIGKTSSADYLTIYCAQSDSSDIHIMPLDNPFATPTQFAAYSEGI